MTLPPSFGSAYVGETFSCTLCANNELQDDAYRRISNVDISAEMQAPTQTLPLDLVAASSEETKAGLSIGQSLQRTVRFDLKEEGNHVLAVSLKYTEIPPNEDELSQGRIRTFRKLYQFVAAPCLSVRTKVSDYPKVEVETEKRLKAKAMTFALEAQLENMADGPITLEKVAFSPKPSFKSMSINWDAPPPNAARSDCPFLMPRDVTQVAFLIKQDSEKQKTKAQVETTKDGRIILGQLTSQWRTSMGDPGFLTTGWLATRKRP
ncbi:MAG: hypothetical protein Q9222_006885 [Ikaeria aurantiellina]